MFQSRTRSASLALALAALGLCLVAAAAAPSPQQQERRGGGRQRRPQQQWQQQDQDQDVVEEAPPPVQQPARQDVSWPQGQDVDQQQPWEQQQQQSQQQTTPAPAEGTLIVLPPSCRCQAIENYNPVCGSDGNTYANRQKLECFAMCGSNVTYVKNGVCRRRQDVPT
ncbi:Serine protease inhibitor dipetalogastin [Frankliniella fusca]|uniref:Serine protease inhibitor dipetalogastin n=1 Tax=Frankliniella fusca TaxID=407009 RepID=A0AAE1HJH5_9NEOP|nr:Serine protease inhibitor dipetalogastin [Frankliniella fusca]